ncbi:MAG: GNAT family N-acetyltransferase [Clostridia bacterium]|nr:GNAT family N-acetyltransferase [Clostridia bacterium]
MNKSIEINYRDNDALRASFNELAGKVFGLSFENWYQNGFWKDNYIPYSVVIDGKVVANVSVNRCDVNYNGETKSLIQLGTVMTDPDHRGKGYARQLMEKIISDYEGKVDGMYLFANDSVTSFYPLFGFKEDKEYQFSKEVQIDNERLVSPVPMNCKEDFDKIADIINKRSQNAKMYMVNNSGLYMFYLSQFMTESVYYLASKDTYLIADIEGDTLILHAIIGDCDLETAISAFGKEIRNVVLCFTPNDPIGYTKQELKEEDTTLFVRGDFFERSWGDDVMFQSITHA